MTRSQSARPNRCRSARGRPDAGRGVRAAQRAPIASGSFASTAIEIEREREMEREWVKWK